jgi:hypothetical protein
MQEDRTCASGYYRPMMHNTATIDIAPTPFQARVLSLPLEWHQLLDDGRAVGT